jgi:hypothetical protein
VKPSLISQAERVSNQRLPALRWIDIMRNYTKRESTWSAFGCVHFKDSRSKESHDDF